MTLAGVMPHTGEPGHVAAPNPESYTLAGGIQPVLDLAASALLPGYAFAQTPNALGLTAADNIINGTGVLLDGPIDVVTFESGGST